MAARCQGPRFYSGQGGNLNRVFCSMRTAVLPLGPQHWVPEPVPSLETHLKSEQVKGRPNGRRYVGRKEGTRLKSNGRQERMENTKHGRRREGRWTPIRVKAEDTRANPNSWETHLVRKRWYIGLLWALSPGFMMICKFVLHTAARLVGDFKKFDHVMNYMCDILRWLPISQRIGYRIWVWPCQLGSTPVCLQEFCCPTSFLAT